MFWQHIWVKNLFFECLIDSSTLQSEVVRIEYYTRPMIPRAKLKHQVQVSWHLNIEMKVFYFFICIAHSCLIWFGLFCLLSWCAFQVSQVSSINTFTLLFQIWKSCMFIYISTQVKPSSNGRNSDGSCMNVGNVISDRPSIRLHNRGKLSCFNSNKIICLSCFSNLVFYFIIVIYYFLYVFHKQILEKPWNAC
jgi:hypothetical protein